MTNEQKLNKIIEILENTSYIDNHGSTEDLVDLLTEVRNDINNKTTKYVNPLEELIDFDY